MCVVSTGAFAATTLACFYVNAYNGRISPRYAADEPKAAPASASADQRKTNVTLAELSTTSQFASALTHAPKSVPAQVPSPGPRAIPVISRGHSDGKCIFMQYLSLTPQRTHSHTPQTCCRYRLRSRRNTTTYPPYWDGAAASRKSRSLNIWPPKECRWTTCNIRLTTYVD